MHNPKIPRNFAPQLRETPYDSVAQLVEQLTLNQWVESSSLSGVTRQSIKMQKTSEIQTISEVFRYPQPAFLRRILKWRGVPKGYIANRSGDCTLARVLNAIVQEFTPFPYLSNYSVEPAFEGTFFIGHPIVPSNAPSNTRTDVFFKSLP